MIKIEVAFQRQIITSTMNTLPDEIILHQILPYLSLRDRLLFLSSKKLIHGDKLIKLRKGICSRICCNRMNRTISYVPKYYDPPAYTNKEYLTDLRDILNNTTELCDKQSLYSDLMQEVGDTLLHRNSFEVYGIHQSIIFRRNGRSMVIPIFAYSSSIYDQVHYMYNVKINSTYRVPNPRLHLLNSKYSINVKALIY